MKGDVFPKILYISIMLLLLLYTVPSGFTEAVIPLQADQEQNKMIRELLDIVKEMSGIDVNAYEIGRIVVTNDTVPVSHCWTEILVVLEREGGGEIHILSTYIDGAFNYFGIRPYGEVLLAEGYHPEGPKEAVMQLLDKCLIMGMINSTFHKILLSLLQSVSCDGNQTVVDEENDLALKVELRLHRSECVFRWYWTKGELKSYRKGIQVYFDMDKGFVEAFIFSWPFYKIGSTDINVSEEEAVQMALEEAEGVINETGAKVKDIDTELVMGRRVDYFTLYPIWLIWIWFDGFYEYGCEKNVIGYHVAIWADTGEIKTKETVALIGGGSGGEGSGQEHEPVAEPNVPPEVPPNRGQPNAQAPPDWPLALALAPVVIATAIVIYRRSLNHRKARR